MRWHIAVALVSLCPWVRGGEVYTSNFGREVGPEWNTTSLRQSTGQRQTQYLGEFTNDSIKLSLAKLPPHAFVRVTFDFYALKSWDGYAQLSRNNVPIGPDVFACRVVGGPSIVRANFSNVMPDSETALPDQRSQSYPGLLATDINPAGSGAVERGTLGEGSDATYRITAIIPHRAASIAIEFQGEGLQDAEDESWGINNVKIESFTEQEVRVPDKALWPKLWKQACGGGTTAQEAFWQLVMTGEEGRAFIKSQITSAGEKIDLKAAEGFVIDLADPDPQLRDRAAASLVALGPDVLAYLDEVLRKKEVSGEQEVRVSEIARKFRGPATTRPTSARGNAVADKLLSAMDACRGDAPASQPR